VETAQSLPELSTLVQQLTDADLVTALSAPGAMTVFAPTNDAFDAISSVLSGLSPEELADALKYHVVPGVAAMSTDLSNDQVLETLFTGHNLTVDLSVAGTVTITGETNSVKVTQANVVCSNGVVHVVDAVLVPTLAPTGTTTPTPALNIVETAQSLPELSTLVQQLTDADLVTALSAPGAMTVFAPTNDAFDAISSVLSGLSPEELADALKYHVVPGVAAMSTDLSNDQVLETLFTGHDLTVDLSVAGTVTITGETNTAKVTLADVVCSNGVVHVVDAVLVPTLELEIVV